MPSTDEVLQLCREAGRTGAFSISESAHARELAHARSATDIRSVLAGAATCTWDGSRWAVTGPSLDGQSVTVLLVIHGGNLSVV